MAVEADESDRSFLRLDPEVAVVTNVELDHHATYASETEVRAAFGSFLERLPADGTAVVWEGAAVERSCRGDGCCGSGSAPMPTCRRGPSRPRHRAPASSWSVTDSAVGDRRAAGARGAQRPERARGARRLRGRGLRLEQAAAALASFRPAGPAVRAARRGARGARVRRLRPSRDGGGGDAAGGARHWSRGGWSPSSSRISTRARCTPTASWAARWRSRTWSWCSTSTRPGSSPRASSPA